MSHTRYDVQARNNDHPHWKTVKSFHSLDDALEECNKRKRFEYVEKHGLYEYRVVEQREVA